MLFVIVLCVANSTLLVRYYSEKQKRLLISQMDVIDDIDVSDDRAIRSTLAKISDKYGFDVEIYRKNGEIIYTTYGNQMMDYFGSAGQNFSMLHERLVVNEKEELAGGAVFKSASQRYGNREFLLCEKEIEDNIFAEVRVQKDMIKSSALLANEFITVIASICFVISLLWVFIFARRFSKPISRMNSITREMSELNFERKLETARTDEIGQLSNSINEMSDSLSAALTELKTANARLTDEIEHERQLDAMRKGFVANVSHELKTPISIISGYAEGLKLNINDKSRDEYCDIIIDESRRMNELVLSILSLSKYESGQIPLECKTFCPKDICEQLTARIFVSADIKTECNVPENIAVFADAAQFEQAVGAFLENARSHTPGGGTVTLTAAENSSNIRVSVFNTGSYVPQEQMPQIWQSFYRGDVSHKRESGRFGLGLSIVGAIAKMHNTPCGVYNTENGVCFWIEFQNGKEKLNKA